MLRLDRVPTSLGSGGWLVRRDGNSAMAGSLGSSPGVTVSDLGNPTCKPLELFICLFRWGVFCLFFACAESKTNK